MSTIRVVNLQHPDSVEPNVVLKTDGTAVFASGITISGNTNLTVSGTAEFASGTAANPEITFIDDNDTGIYSPAANEVAITTSGTEQLRVDNSGDVGIGTANPDKRLHVTDADNTGFVGARIQNNNSLTGTAGIEFSTDSTYAKAAIGHLRDSLNGHGDIVFYNDSNNDAANWQTSDEKMRLTSDGKVGIGTSSPFSALHALYSGSGSSVASSGTTDATTGARIGRGAVGIDFGILDNGTSYLQNRNVSDFAVNYNFIINPNGGNIGIATSSPAKDLDVNGEIRAADGILFGTDTAAANTLDDYEESTWTPTIIDGITSPVLTTANGNYTKIGRAVYFNFEIRVTSGTPNSNTFTIGGLPFVSAALAQNFSSVNINYNNILTGFTELRAGHITTGNNRIVFYNGTGTINGNSAGVSWVNGRRLIADGVYLTA